MKDYTILNNHSLKRFHSFRLEVIAHQVVLPLTKRGLIEALKDFKDKTIILLGKGSNTVFKQAYYDESYVFIVTILLDKVEVRDGVLYSQAGTSLNKLAWFACEHSIGPYAYLEDIPGTLGGGLWMNAGQFDQSLSQDVVWLEVFDQVRQEVIRISPDDNFFGYRSSRLQENPWIVLSCGLRIRPQDYHQALSEILDLRYKRYVKQPRQFANAGSTFKRPKDEEGHWLYIWKLFDEVGLRGYRLGDIEVSSHHPGFIINHGKGTLEDLWQVISECKKRVADHFHIDIDLEWVVH